MKSKRKIKRKRKLFVVFILILSFAFLFKNKVKNLGAKKENFEAIAKINENIFMNEEGKLFKGFGKLNLPYIKGDFEITFDKRNSDLYPCAEILKIIKLHYPEFFDSIESIDINNYKIIFKNGKIGIIGIGNFEKKLEILFKNYKYIKDENNLNFLSFKKKEE